MKSVKQIRPNSARHAESAGLRLIAPGLWTYEGRVDVGWLAVPCRMVVVELAPRKLWVHSPFDAERVGDAVSQLGDVLWRVAPNAWHHLGQSAWQARFPNSQLAAAAALQSKRSDLRVDLVLDEAPADTFGDRLALQTVSGSPGGETVFLHRPSRSLIVTDLGAHMDDSFSAGFRAYGRIAGIRKGFAVSRFLRMMYRDRSSAAGALGRILAWNPVRIVPAHGPIIEQAAPQVLCKAFDWLAAHADGR